MKKLLLVAILGLTAAFVHAQGTVSFVNSTTTKVTYDTGTGTTAPIPVGNPNPNWVAGLFWGTEGTPQGSLTQIATTQVWQPFTGVFSGGTVTFPVAGGTRVSLQVRAWNVATPSLVGFGPIQLITLGGAGTPPGAPASLTAPTTPGDTAFAGFLVPVPEPSSIALGLLGLGAVALFRRRK
jgi:hypothetical protein